MRCSCDDRTHAKWLKKKEELLQHPSSSELPTPPSTRAVMSTLWLSVIMTPASVSRITDRVGDRSYHEFKGHASDTAV